MLPDTKKSLTNHAAGGYDVGYKIRLAELKNYF